MQNWVYERISANEKDGDQEKNILFKIISSETIHNIAYIDIHYIKIHFIAKILF